MKTEKVTLQLATKEARELYKTGSKEIQTILESTLGKDFFSQSVCDRVNTMDDVFRETGRPHTPAFNDVPEDLRPYFKEVYDNVIIVEALNEGEKMDIYNSDKARYYPWFITNGSAAAFAFRYSAYDFTAASAASGSRLSLKNSDLAKHYGVQFKDKVRKMLEL
ncbi:hypothetical protein [Dysgonomonas sp. ZJ279]|uniref:hypothetical protein n=1 Tax=Dysgonomonas sp. ZJ279 TaxID=2709796 RepID=UPI0013EA6CA4|nr:hypothetical protein [Dysgonomonas sp. ZJ279]